MIRSCSRIITRFMTCTARRSKIFVRRNEPIMPESTYVKELQKNVAHIDRENAFLLYAAFTGDLERTAHSLGIRTIDVLNIANEDHWNEKLKGILDLKKSGKPGDIERACNRALNFVQSHRMRMIIERAIRDLSQMSDEELREHLFTDTIVEKDGTISKCKKLVTRPLADLAAAIEKCHAMSYAALNDTTQERIKRDNTGKDEVAAGEMHVQLARAMSEAGKSKSIPAQLLDAQLAIAATVAEEAKSQ